VIFRLSPKNHSLRMLRYHSWTAKYELPDGSKEPFFRGVLRYHSWTAVCELPDGSAEPFFRGVAVPPMDSRLCSFLATAEALYPVEHRASCSAPSTKPQIIDGCASTTGSGYDAAPFRRHARPGSFGGEVLY